MKRYNNKEEVKIGDRVLLDNTTGFFRDIVRVNIVGDVIDVELNGDLIQVSFKVNGIKDPIIKDVPYYLCQ